MSKRSCAKFVLSHSRQLGYDFGERFSEIIEDKNTQNWIKSYISMLTDYASDSRYISTNFKSLSYFVKENYLTIVKSYPQKDNRFFLESEVYIVNLLKDTFNFNALLSDFHSSATYTYTEFLNNLNQAILSALLSENTTLYCIANSDKLIESFYSLVYSFDERILFRNSCIEAVGDIPAVQSSIVLCRCVVPEDYELFRQKIRQDPNCIIVDLTATPIIEISIFQPSFAQTCLDKLSRKYGWESLYYSLLESMNKDAKLSSTSKRAFFNAVSFLSVRANYPSEIGTLVISAGEKKELENLLK